MMEASVNEDNIYSLFHHHKEDNHNIYNKIKTKEVQLAVFVYSTGHNRPHEVRKLHLEVMIHHNNNL